MPNWGYFQTIRICDFGIRRVADTSRNLNSQLSSAHSSQFSHSQFLQHWFPFIILFISNPIVPHSTVSIFSNSQFSHDSQSLTTLTYPLSLNSTYHFISSCHLVLFHLTSPNPNPSFYSLIATSPLQFLSSTHQYLNSSFINSYP